MLDSLRWQRATRVRDLSENVIARLGFFHAAVDVLMHCDFCGYGMSYSYHS